MLIISTAYAIISEALSHIFHLKGGIVDKRIVKTREAIFNAFLDLAAQKDIDKISVVELCEKAEINKSTFYLHYKSIDECFQACFDYFSSQIVALGKDIDYSNVSVSPEKNVKEILDAVEQNTRYFDKFKNTLVYDYAIKALKENMVEAICKVNEININDNYHEVVKVTFLVGGCADVITRTMPNINREEVEKLMVDVIKRK